MRIALAICAALAFASVANASQLIDRNATGVSLKVNNKGEAMITYRAAGKLRHVLAWGAVNAKPPNQSTPQVKFSLDYSGGYGKYHRTTYWQVFNGSCLPYDGPPLAWKVVACKAPDGSYWALQAWQRGLPDYALAPTTTNEGATELHLSHWTGALPVLDIHVAWAYRKYDKIFGTYTYGGIGVYGFHSTSAGAPLDTYGRNIYVDTLNSAYGQGWKRDNSFLTHGTGGSFCYGFYPHGSHPSGMGAQYRATAEGPGVAPDVMWQGASPGPFNADAESALNDMLRALNDPKCKPN